MIQTLNPSRLRPSDYVHLAGTTSTVWNQDSTFQLAYKHLDSKHLPFPPGSSGFLYLSSCADKPQSAWQIRFRVTENDTPQSFKLGADLLLPDQRPWSVLLRHLGSKKHSALWELLVQDGLINDALVSVFKSIYCFSHRQGNTVSSQALLWQTAYTYS